MRALVVGDLDAASSELGAKLPDDFADDLSHFLEYRLAQVEEDPGIRQWLGRVMVMEEGGAPLAVGSIGFHGPPDAEGRVEVGYRVDPAHRRRGLASEAVAAMFEWARREHGVHRFRASTAPDNVASQGVIARFGFRQTGVQWDDVDGEELVFEMDDPDVAADLPS